MRCDRGFICIWSRFRQTVWPVLYRNVLLTGRLGARVVVVVVVVVVGSSRGRPLCSDILLRRFRIRIRILHTMSFKRMLLAQLQNVVLAQRTLVVAPFDPQVQAIGVIDVSAVQFPDLVGVLDQVDADGADQSRRSCGEVLDVRFLFLGAPVAQGLRRGDLFEFFQALAVFGRHGYTGRFRIRVIDTPC